MILTPASTSRSATSWAASAGTARTPTTTSSSATTVSSSEKSPHRDAADLGADALRVDVEDRDDPEAVVGEDVRAGDRLAEVAGAEQRDVVLPGGAQDLADLARPATRPVADPALPELAEAGEVAADLGRVDVGVLGELLGGDRLLAHLARLGQHLEVAREARGDAEREALAVQAARSSAPSRRAGHRPRFIAPKYRSSGGTKRRRVRHRARRPRALELDHRDPLEVAPRKSASSESMSTSRSSRSSASATTARPAPAPRRRGGSPAAAYSDQRSLRHRRVPGQVLRVRRRGRAYLRGRGDHRRVVGAQLGRDELQPQPRAPRRAAPPARAAACWRRRRRRAPPPASRPRPAPVRAWPRAARRPPPGSSPRGRPSAPRPRPRPSSRTA